MKYIYVKKIDGSLKYLESKGSLLRSKHIAHIEVSDDFILPEGGDIVFQFKNKLSKEELSNKRLVLPIKSGNFKARKSKSEIDTENNNARIKKSLVELDLKMPRALEDVIDALIKDGKKFDKGITDKITEKKALRSQLK